MIRFNESTGKYEVLMNGKVICKTGRESHAHFIAKKNGLTAGAQIPAPVAAAPKSEFSVQERFDFIEKFVGMVARKVIPSLVLSGDGGLGKTYTVTETLKRLGKKELEIGSLDGDYITVKGYSTAKNLYRTLWENNGMIIIFDDCDSVLKDPIATNILKGALDSGEKRVITWGAEFSEREELPNRFEFTGQVIFISNLPQTKIPQPILSRALRVDLTLSTEEKVDRIEQVMANNDADASDIKATLQFIRKHAAKATDLNIRSAMTILKLRQQFGDDFARIAEYNFTA